MGEVEKWGEGRDRTLEREMERKGLRLEAEDQLASGDWGGTGHGLSLERHSRPLQSVLIDFVFLPHFNFLLKF